jgi:hypothetical protein
MKKKWFFMAVFILVFHWMIIGTSAQTPKPTKTLTLLYTNNINGEIEPCPT